MSEGTDIHYDPAALTHYEDAHATIQQAGSLAQEINDVFQTQIPQVFVAGASESIRAHHRIIHEKFEDAHAQLVKLLGETAPGEIHDMFGLDQRLSDI
ncbi:hypothetical protein [Mycobacterium vicinigordonae]|uniref:PE domain-containing protein n=1 Tax=Mycobacterium vicinigordonae TaxID=1719132 RepID=A0A7D6IK48_9MYCO|nr:hypothetical protein [Mycobacterium vicinigordonae]QLL06000.1 hypothetical protein H0P51_19745 [Mycobacterium vicinigordonae]